MGHAHWRPVPRTGQTISQAGVRADSQPPGSDICALFCQSSAVSAIFWSNSFYPVTLISCSWIRLILLSTQGHFARLRICFSLRTPSWSGMAASVGPLALLAALACLQAAPSFI